MKSFKPRNQSGQALVEFAFILPLLLALLIGVIEFGRYAYISILIGNAAHAGALYGAQSAQQAQCAATPCGIQQAAINDFHNNGQDPAKLHVCDATAPCTVTCGCDSAGTFTAATGCDFKTNPSAGSCPGVGSWVIVVTVTAKGTFNALFNYPGIPTSLTITRTEQMRVA